MFIKTLKKQCLSYIKKYIYQIHDVIPRHFVKSLIYNDCRYYIKTENDEDIPQMLLFEY
jgi:hypothetical protein